MQTRRTELRDELAALIAAGRELSPDHDQVLAEVFIDRVAGRTPTRSRARSALAVLRKPRRLLGAIVLGLACLGTGSLLSAHDAAGSNGGAAPVSAKAAAVRVVGKVPTGPKAPLAPKAPMASKAPMSPQAPVAPQGPSGKTAP